MHRPAASLIAALATALLLAGCAAGSDAAPPTSSAEPAPNDAASDEPQDAEMKAAWLDEGRAFAVVTWGSSGCVPIVSEVTADGQRLEVVLADPEDAFACTEDFAPRASFAMLPAGVDAAQDVELSITYGDLTGDAELDGDADLSAEPGSQTEYLPSAGWYDDNSLVLLTWGSSSCPPLVDMVKGSGRSGMVTFVSTADRICTADMGPRATLLSFDGDVDDDGFELALAGDGSDTTVSVRG